ncbi:hypothetical protein V499_07338 [Pseudogymnoascus sp. VKM F-103]|uniref:LysM domain-containing protein n=1 Tax=Pseudogymnoascus verrucosus TaxID=342668 RepID=A0A1B8GPY0_9PEZI|nr:uncharacterized protein VE01_03920 [Pseudogymnoascus verrucosus]KFY72525.1 hypothetical protein V499_07338 [Pseudogymnoascus sp. VKM F-103]OBT97887.1 hypothetical protein VE01_03920 [Pseudogymnoascus verrucosus]
MLHLSILATIGVLAAHSVALGVKRFDSSTPFYSYDPNTPAACTLWWNSDDGISCDTVLLIVGISVGQLTAWNPSIKSCADWKADYSYCVEGPAPSIPTTTSTTSTTSKPVTTSKPATTSTAVPPTTTKPSNGVTTPEPVQPGMVDNCNRFYKVKNGDTCTTIASSVGVTIAQLASWNTQIGGTACTGIWADYNICTGVIGGTPTSPGNGIATPTPVQPGMVTNCNKFYKVKAGDTCVTIASSASVTVAQLATWNTQIGGTACTGMWADYNICTGVIGSTPNPTPQPIQTGMVTNCKKFHLVKTGESCDTITRLYSITVANFIKWNPAAGASCTGLWANTYACVGL